MEFKEYYLGELCEIKSSKRIYAKDYVNKGIPFYRSKEIIEKSKGLDISQNLYIDNKKFEEIEEKHGIPETGDLLLTSVGTLGVPYIVKNEKFYFKDGNLTWFTNFKSLLNQYYLFYWFKSKEGIGEINRVTIGSTQKALTIKNLRYLKITLPDKKNQFKIINLIQKIENKLENNKQVIANLEELSKTLFKRWFVDFEFPDENGNPYKSSGGEMVDSELGEIPEGWKIGHFSHFCKKPIAGDWGKEQKQGNYVKPVRVIRGADINDYSKGGKGKSPIRFILQKNFDNKKLISGDIIVEISGGSPTQSTGRTLLINNKVLKNSEYELVCTNFCKVIRPLDEKFGEWLAYYFNYLYFRDVFFNYENGTTGIKNLDYKSIMNTMKIIAPSTQILNNFHNLISKYKINIQYLGMENDYLTQLRDTLLPKLMSGEIEIPDDIEVNEDELSI